MIVALAVLGAVLALALLSVLARRNPRLPGRGPSLVSWTTEPPDHARPSELVAWESLLLSGATGGRRGRARLARRLEPLVASLLLERRRATMDDPAVMDLLGGEWAYLRGDLDATVVEPDAGVAVCEAVEALLDRLGDSRPGPRT